MRTKDLNKAIEEIIAKDNHRKHYEILYNILDILDSKTASLLTFNGIIIAAFTILTTDPSVLSNPFLVVSLAIGILLSILACAVGFWVVRVKWQFLDYKSLSEEFKDLAKVIDKRTWRYKVSWWFSFVSILILGAVILHRFVQWP